MNGRIYDPLLGRFLSADIVVQAPHFLQSYNRYSYTLNNPLKYYDLSGYTFDSPYYTGQPSSRNDELVKTTALTVGKEYAKLSGADSVVSDITLLANPVTSSLVLAPEIAQDFQGFVEGEAIGAGAGFILQTAFKATGGRLRKLGSSLFRLFRKNGDEVSQSITNAEKRLDNVDIEARPSTNPSVNAPATNPSATENPATKNRVKLRKETRHKIDENQPRNAEGEMIDPYSKEPLQPGEIDVGHRKGQEWRKRKKMHNEAGSTRREVIETENDPDLYYYQDRHRNRSHVDEED